MAKRTSLLLTLAVVLAGFAPCGVAIAAQDLIQDNGDGSGAIVGTVTVTDNGGTLNVAFAANPPYLLMQAHAAAGAVCDDIPQNRNGNPKVGKFEDSWTSAGLPGSTAVNLTLDDAYDDGTDICIAAHAIVYDSSGGATPEEAFFNTVESAWADGDGFPGRSWATHFPFQTTPASCADGAACTVFVTSASFNGNLVTAAANRGLGDFTGNGVGAGDAICNDLAQDASLPGTFKAWLSASPAIDPESTFVQAAVPYRRTDGTLVANDWTGLITFNPTLLAAPINHEEDGAAAAFAEVWAATSPLGTYDGLNTCAGWTSDAAPPARHGRNDLTDSRWTEWDVAANCAEIKRLYCFQQ